MNEINKNLASSKQLHEKRQTVCCGLNFFKSTFALKNDKNEQDHLYEKDKKYNDFIQLLENLKYDSKVKDINFPIEHNNNNLKINFNTFPNPNEVEIELMGDYRYAMNQNKPLRNPYLFDDEIPYK